MSKYAIDLVNPSNGQHSCIFVDVNDGFEPSDIRVVKPDQASFEVEAINPRTGEHRKILVELSSKQAEAAISAPWLTEYVQALAKSLMPDGFLPLCNGVRPVTLN